MTEARRSVLPEPSDGHHPGLILDRYLAIADDNGHSKADLYRHAIQAMNSPQLLTFYKAAWERIKAAMVPATWVPCPRVSLKLKYSGVLGWGLTGFAAF